MKKERKDDKGRILKTGEYYDPEKKRYRFRYKDAKGNYHEEYAFRLTKNDPVPMDKPVDCREPLREIEKRVLMAVQQGIDTKGANMSMLALVKEYTDFRMMSKQVRKTTIAGYRTVLKFLEGEKIAKKKIKDISTQEAKKWFVELQQSGRKKYSGLNQLKGVLKPAFKYAIDSDWLLKNPFDFSMGVLVDDREKRDAITRDQMRAFLKFAKETKPYNKHYDGFFLLFNTGMRCSEMCGLTFDDIDFEGKTIRIERQLLRTYDKEAGVDLWYINDAKTAAGMRTIPMMPEVEACLRHVVESRMKCGTEITIDGISGFLFLDKDGKPTVENHWAKYFQHCLERYNEIYKKELPKITPHVCRHTYVSNMIGAGMAPVTLMKIVGHSDFTTTANVYTDLGIDVLSADMLKLHNSNYSVMKYENGTED